MILKSVNGKLIDIQALDPASSHSYTQAELEAIYNACDTDYERSIVTDRLYFSDGDDTRKHRRHRRTYSFYTMDCMRRLIARDILLDDSLTA